MKKSKINNKKINTKEYNSYLYAVLIAVCFLVGLPAYFRGMYFEKEQFILYLLNMAVFLTYIYIKALKKEKFTINKPLDITLLALVFAYIISSFFAINVRLAISEVLKYVNLFVIYIMVKELVNSSLKLNIFVNSVAFFITGVAFIGIGAAANTFPYNGAYSLAENERWINSTLQYHNAFAAFCLCGLMLLYSLYGKSTKLWQKIVYSACGYIITVGFIFTYSRGAWLVFPIVFAVLLVLSFKYFFEDVLLYSLIISVGSGIIAKGFRDAMVARNSINTWKWFLIGLLITIILAFLLNLFIKFLNKHKISFKRISIIATALILLLVIVTLIFTPNVLLKFLPSDVVGRLSAINLTSISVTERFVFYKDAINLALKSPIIGSGGNAWRSTYFMYQSYLYWSNQSHSYIMQVLVETGTIGLIIFILILAYFYYMSIKNLKALKEDKEKYIIFIGVFLSANALIIHSFIDFDLSLLGVSIVLWALFGVTSSLYQNGFFFKTKQKSLAYFAFASVIVFIMSAFLANANYLAEKGDLKIKSKNLLEAKKIYEMATVSDPLNPDYMTKYVDLSIKYAMTNKENNDFDKNKTDNFIKSALNIDKFGVQTNDAATQYYFAIGDYKNGLLHSEKRMVLQPLNPDTYYAVSDAYIQLSKIYMQQNKNSEAKELLTSCIKIPNIINEINTKKLKPVVLNEKTIQNINEAKALINTIK